MANVNQENNPQELLLYNGGLTRIVPYERHWVVTLTKSNVKPKYQMCVPKRAFHFMPDHSKEITLLLDGVVRDEGTFPGEYEVDAIYGMRRISYKCWRDFAKYIKLRIRDRVLFMVGQEKNNRLRLHAKVIPRGGILPIPMVEAARGVNFLQR